MKKIDKIFQPKSIAVIGASRDKDKLGHQILENLIRSEYRGKIYPINPRAKIIHGLKAYASVKDVPGSIDMAVFVVPSSIVNSVMEEVGRKKIPVSVIITAGFGELGEEGKNRESELLKIAQKHGTRIVGPNCLGVIDTFTPMNVSFANSKPIKHNLAVVSQSGAMCTAILDWSVKNNIGFSKFISLGNKIDVDEVDIFPELLKDKNTKVVLGYFEGIKKGADFIKNAQALTSKKPLIAIKAGQSKAGAKAASSHTGALTSDNDAINAAFKKAGITRVNNIEELFDFSEAFSILDCPKDNRIAVLTNAGGPGVLTTDFISRSNLELAKLSLATIRKFKKSLPEEAAKSNPVDVVGDADSKRYELAADILMSDKNVSALLVLLTPQTSTEIEKTAKALIALKNKYHKPLVASFIGGTLVDKGISILEKGGIPNFEFPERAVKALSQLFAYRKSITTSKIISKKALRQPRIENIIKKALREQKKNLNDRETKDVMKAIGIETAKSRLVKNVKEARKAAKNLGYPNVAKIVSSDVLHKTEYGLVKVGISSEKEAEKAFSEIMKNAKKLHINYEGVMFYEQVKDGIELIIGAKRDDSFGPVLMFGLGGTLVELLRDTAHTIAPISDMEAKDMIFSIKGHKLLTGYRGKEGVDIKKVKNALIKVGDLMNSFPEIKELDINPLKADSRGVKALDIKIVLSGS